ncbi:MAG: YraN family protein [Planctomycetales bacterium 4484_123]|nr:MAG: YraN family protein [Planctomycetales bacterium 4484_123]
MWPFRRRGSIGQQGEELAVKYLRRAGHKVLARNYRCPLGEADVITLDSSTKAELGSASLVFVEVKTRSSDEYASPESAVDRRKQQKLIRVARYYLAHHDVGEYPVRFDVVAVLLVPGGKGEVRHIVDAFRPG